MNENTFGQNQTIYKIKKNTCEKILFSKQRETQWKKNLKLRHFFSNGCIPSFPLGDHIHSYEAHNPQLELGSQQVPVSKVYTEKRSIVNIVHWHIIHFKQDII